VKRKVRILRRSLPLWLIALLIIASGIGAAVGTILAGKITGEVPVQVGQSLLVGEPSFPGSLPGGVNIQSIRIKPSAMAQSIGIVADDWTSFKAAVEANTGDVFLIKLPLKNASTQDMMVELTLDVPECLEVDAFGSDDESDSAVDHVFNVTQVGFNKFVFRLSHLAEVVTSDWRDSIGIVVGVDDTCRPGFYSIGANLVQIPGGAADKPVLTLSKTGATTANLNEQITYTIRVNNTSESTDATELVITDTLPAGMTYVSSSPTANVTGNEVAWSLGTLAARNSSILQLTARTIQSGRWTNRATATCAEDVTIEASATTEVGYVGLGMVSLSKYGPSQLTQGTTGTYTITASNTGGTSLTGVTITDQIPSGMSYVSSSPTGSVSGNTVTWSLGTIYASQSRQVTLTLRGNTAGTWNNYASLTCYQGLTDTASVTTQVGAAPGGMTMSTTDTKDPIAVGETTTYIVTATNQGSTYLHNLRIVNAISSLMSFVSASGPSTYTVSGQTVTFSPVTTVAPHQTLTYYITVRAVSAGSALNLTTMTYDEFALPLTAQEGTAIY
jgi:uncharacterized repeat protein (TIGR01451 family)